MYRLVSEDEEAGRIYILNYAAGKQMQDKEKLFVLFADMDEAYDMVDRKELSRVMKRMEINQQLMREIEDV